MGINIPGVDKNLYMEIIEPWVVECKLLNVYWADGLYYARVYFDSENYALTCDKMIIESIESDVGKNVKLVGAKKTVINKKDESDSRSTYFLANYVVLE